jgi:hypothetical protein
MEHPILTMMKQRENEAVAKVVNELKTLLPILRDEFDKESSPQMKFFEFALVYLEFLGIKGESK